MMPYMPILKLPPPLLSFPAPISSPHSPFPNPSNNVEYHSDAIPARNSPSVAATHDQIDRHDPLTSQNVNRPFAGRSLAPVRNVPDDHVALPSIHRLGVPMRTRPAPSLALPTPTSVLRGCEPAPLALSVPPAAAIASLPTGTPTAVPKAQAPISSLFSPPALTLDPAALIPAGLEGYAIHNTPLITCLYQMTGAPIPRLSPLAGYDGAGTVEHLFLGGPLAVYLSPYKVEECTGLFPPPFRGAGTGRLNPDPLDPRQTRLAMRHHTATSTLGSRTYLDIRMPIGGGDLLCITTDGFVNAFQEGVQVRVWIRRWDKHRRGRRRRRGGMFVAERLGGGISGGIGGSSSGGKTMGGLRGASNDNKNKGNVNINLAKRIHDGAAKGKKKNGEKLDEKHVEEHHQIPPTVPKMLLHPQPGYSPSYLHDHYHPHAWARPYAIVTTATISEPGRDRGSTSGPLHILVQEADDKDVAWGHNLTPAPSPSRPPALVTAPRSRLPALKHQSSGLSNKRKRLALHSTMSTR